MEAARNLLSSASTFSTRIQLKSSVFPSSSSSVSMFHEQAAPTATSVPITSVARHFLTSVLSQEQRDDYRPLPVLQFIKEDKAYVGTTDKQRTENRASLHEEKASNKFGQLGFEQQSLHWPDLKQLLSRLELGENPSFSFSMQSVAADTKEIMNVEPSLGSANSSTLPVEEEEEAVTVRMDVRRKLRESFDSNDPLRLFLWGPETKQLLTAKEESELVIQVQDLKRLVKVKSKLQSQFGREPTLVEWAQAMALSCPVLQAKLHSGNRSREKLIYANLRMVVHIAKQYQGRGLSLQDLLQEESMGLMKGIEKFKPQVGCRVATYAYWWIRKTITKSIMQHSRTILLPENLYSLLGKVLDAKKSYIQEGNHCPSKEELARRVGITVEKLDKLLLTTRMPLSMQQPVWADQDTTFQEVTPDTGIETPDVSVAKQLMRQHKRNLLSVLSPKERR
ncbi:hypothetical protein DITRI_Ditri12bG0150600 [Diplodiscus trichospermus]